MSTIKFIFKDLSVMKLWSVWRRRYIVATVVRRCIRDRGFREAILRFKHTILRQRKALLVAAMAGYKNHSGNPGCDQSISDGEMQALLSELDSVQSLAKMTLYCTSCGKRLVIDRKQPGVRYCVCKDPKPMGDSSEGWKPYMETEDVIIWRKEYKPGKGLYAYKVYGRYPEVQAKDFAAVQIDGAYRRVWDSAVAALAVVQTDVGGVPGQAVVHWEVLWPRLFANRDYVYIRRHKEFDIRTTSPPPTVIEEPTYPNSVHSNAKRKSIESPQEGAREIRNKAYIIMNKSCVHPDVPETRNAIRVTEYWSHMVVKTVDGTNKAGMEFVLTYYDEPAVGGMPGGVAAWASSHAAPLFLERMRRAAHDYQAWAGGRSAQELPDFVPFGPERVQRELVLDIQEKDMEVTSTLTTYPTAAGIHNDDDIMKSSKQGPELENEIATRDQSSQTDTSLLLSYIGAVKKDVRSDSGNLKDEKNDANGNENEITVKGSEDTKNDSDISTDVKNDSDKSKDDSDKSKDVSNDNDRSKDGGNDTEESKDVSDKGTSDEDIKSGEEKGGENRVMKDGKKSVNGDEGTSGGEKESKSGEEREAESEKASEEGDGNSSWWRYLYPFYYFV